MWFYLLSSANDEDPTEDKALSQNVSHEAPLKGPQAVQPHPDAQEREKTHLALTGAIKTPLQTKTDKQEALKSFMETQTAADRS
ncbi:hypothetical protein EYF80_004869 [Liparis tanakae]|uniref:Uncharacterized protein n=1 Tax=Liparis tanakae TaxID=230148 RepID=A0A4Z2J4K4_9TELE|nr:hypothetical protein EYF80_004869 [Liparis tanakae]